MLRAMATGEAPAGGAAGDSVWVGAEVSCRLTTDDDFTSPQPALVVQSLAWDSGFRAAGVRPGDRIVAVEGAPLAPPSDPLELSRALARMVGQLDEEQAWAAAGRKDGDPVTLTVRRRRPPAGWETLELTGALRAERSWTRADGRRIIGPGGPEEMQSDGFSAGGWSSWYEKVAATWERALAWHRQGSLVSHGDIDVDQASERVPKLAELYPGPFADAVAADWAAVQAIVDGRAYTLEPGALDFRALGERLVEDVRSAGAAAREAFVAAHAAELIAPFPSIDPILGDRASVAGKLVELPRITQREWVSQGDRTVFVFAQGEDCYIAEVGGATERMLLTQRRYEKLVSPQIRSEYEVIGRIGPDPTMALFGEQAFFALRVEPVAATVGGAFFVDLTTGADPAPFAGEEDLRREDVLAPGPEAAPEAVLAAMIGALKTGDVELWKSTFSDWTFFVADDGRPVISPFGPSNLDSNWDFARRRILDDVVDVRPVWVGDPVTVFRSDAFDGAPQIDQTTIEVDHLRLAGEDPRAAHSFSAVGLHRIWTLQRINGGPWRIATDGGI
jgi:hypothetical protein